MACSVSHPAIQKKGDKRRKRCAANHAQQLQALSRDAYPMATSSSRRE
jgi:hypothetical protein